MFYFPSKLCKPLFLSLVNASCELTNITEKDPLHFEMGKMPFSFKWIFKNNIYL